MSRKKYGGTQFGHPDGYPVWEFTFLMEGDNSVIYISFDLESLGGNPFDFPVINWGFVAYTSNRVKLGELSVNTKPFKADQATIDWFNSTPELKQAYEKCTKDPLEPIEGMRQIRDWIQKISSGKKTLLVAYPTIYDGSLLYAYWFNFLGHPNGGKGGPGFTILDIRSYAAGDSVFRTLMRPRKRP